MCGICGFVEFNRPSPLAQRKERLLNMCNIIRHRGPDDTGTWFSKDKMSLGAVRLSILDLQGGHQPLGNEDQSCWVSQNGEIYNYPTLRRELQELGHVFKTRVDTEAIVHAYEEWGADCVTHLDGMFAFAVWDENKQQLLLARDRMGQKPLYYTQIRQTFIFASEIKALLKHPLCQDELDSNGLDMFLSLSYIPGPHTIFSNIKKLMPGHILLINRRQEIKTIPYWDIPPGAPQLSPAQQDQAARQLENILDKSVQARLLADVPVGVFLSGGLDSSLITALLKRHKADKLKSFSVSFREPEHDESSFAAVVANFLGTEHYELAVNHCSPELLQKLVWHTDEPLADPAIVPTYLVSELARKQVKVVLTGEGADELFAGYFYHPLERQAAKLDWMPAWSKRGLLVPAAKAVNWAIGRQRYHPRTLWSWQLQPAERWLAWMSIFTDEEKKRWLSPAIQAAIPRQAAAGVFRQTAQAYHAGDWLAQFSYLDEKIPLVDGLLMKVDKMSMAASLEARCPFLDHRLVEFAATLPETMKLKQNIGKALLRQVADNLLPPEITQRKKHGFDVPIERWLKEDLHAFFWDTVSANAVEKFGVIQKAQLQGLWDEMQQGVPNRVRQLWSLLILSTWYDAVY